MPLPAHLDRAYRRSRYCVAGVALKIGRRSGALDGVLSGMGVRHAVLMTAWNPASRRMPPNWNARMMAALRSRLGDATQLPATGGDGTWHEDHLLVAGDRRRMAVLARIFRQSAMIGLNSGRSVQLLNLV